MCRGGAAEDRQRRVTVPHQSRSWGERCCQPVSTGQEGFGELPWIWIWEVERRAVGSVREFVQLYNFLERRAI
jgi:hypothetical protein